MKVCAALHLTTAPDVYPMATGSEISALWVRRNQCDDSEIGQIDYNMEIAAINGWIAVKAQSIRENLGRARVIDKGLAIELMRSVAPSQQRVENFADRLCERGSILLISPDGVGGLRHDQPGTLSHTPHILFAPRSCSLPTLTLARTLVLRVK